jgi:Fe-Mn family superoxide dismutase
MSDDIKISDDEIRKAIRKSLNKDTPQKSAVPPGQENNLNEAYVTQAKVFSLSTEFLSDKNKIAHQELFEGYVKSLNKISAELDVAPREDANSNDSTFRSLKIDEAYNLNGAFLHGLFFENISDMQSKITMDSLVYMRLERDFGTFDEWQKDFIACAMSARNGWAVTVYNTFLKRYINVVVDLHNINIPFSSFPVVVLDMWEHSYYRDYLNDKKSYIFAMMKELDWDKINDRVKKAEKVSKVLGQ